MKFRDRDEAGVRLVERLKQYKAGQTIALAVPRGGVPVAVKIAEGLHVPLDVVVIRKIQIPDNPEAGYGAVAEDGTVFLNEPMVRQLGLSQNQIDLQTKKVLDEIHRRSFLYRKIIPRLSIVGKTVIIIDDGLASGFTMVAAIKSVQRRGADIIVVASPVASGDAYHLLKPIADQLVCLVISRSYPFAVASFYDYWYDLTDEEVVRYLQLWQDGVKIKETL